MILNNLEIDVKVKCLESNITQAQLGEKIGTTGQYVNRVIKNKKSILNKTFVKMLENLGYDIKLIYVPKERD
ncbi:MAG: helix-turn-helix transcriptional regulator [Oscillospiraceae bacterium]|nr:helix-turn-helix transcriptional regulator [Oscillospiraceae bacterium]